MSFAAAILTSFPLPVLLLAYMAKSRASLPIFTPNSSRIPASSLAADSLTLWAPAFFMILYIGADILNRSMRACNSPRLSIMCTTVLNCGSSSRTPRVARQLPVPNLENSPIPGTFRCLLRVGNASNTTRFSPTW